MKNHLTLLLIAICKILSAQDYTVKYISDDITIDGVESEKVWEKANIGNDFWQWRPSDNVKAIKQTEFKAVFDDENLYFLVKSFTKEKEFTSLFILPIKKGSILFLINRLVSTHKGTNP